MAAAKTKFLNRAVFNEKLLHRYLLETYYYGDREVVAALLPRDDLRRKKIRMVIPEVHDKERPWRPDLRLHFQGDTTWDGIPVEVKWTRKGLSKPNQVTELESQGGFVVTLSQDHSPIGRIPHVPINLSHFHRWFQESVSRLAKDLLADRLDDVSNFQFDRSHWLVVLRGASPREAFTKMRKLPPKSIHTRPFWAFKNEKGIVRELLRIRPGDRILFLFGTIGTTTALRRDARAEPLSRATWFEGVVANPYFMVPGTEDLGSFYEEGYEVGKSTAQPIGLRTWTHYIDFVLDQPRYLGPKADSPPQSRLSRLGDFAAPVQKSVSLAGGGPVSMGVAEMDQLIDALRVGVDTPEPVARRRQSRGRRR